MIDNIVINVEMYSFDDTTNSYQYTNMVETDLLEEVEEFYTYNHVGSQAIDWSQINIEQELLQRLRSYLTLMDVGDITCIDVDIIQAFPSVFESYLPTIYYQTERIRQIGHPLHVTLTKSDTSDTKHCIIFINDERGVQELCRAIDRKTSTPGFTKSNANEHYVINIISEEFDINMLKLERPLIYDDINITNFELISDNRIVR